MANSKNTDFTGNLQGVALDGHNGMLTLPLI
jgi:hypothetical protein